MLFAIMLLAVVAVSRVGIIAFGLAGEHQEVVAKLMNVILTGLTSVTVIAASRRMTVPGTRRAWCVVGLGAGANFVGDTLYLLVGLVYGETPFPSIADVAYLLYYPLILAGLLVFPRRPSSFRERLTFWLDAFTTTVGGGIVFWYFLIYPIAVSQESGRLAALVGAAYPVADLVLILAVATVALGPSPAFRPRLAALLAGSIVAFMFGDAAYGTLNVSGQYVSGQPLTLLSEVPFESSYLLLALAAWMARRGSRGAAAMDGGVRSRPLTLLPYLAVVLGYGLLLWVSFGDLPDSVQGLIVGAVILTGLVVARQIVAVRENSRLQAVQAVQRSESRFRSLVQHASDVITIVDGGGRVTFQSPSLKRVFGYEPEVILGQSVVHLVHPLVHPEDRARAQAFLEAALRPDSTDSTIGWRVRHRDGRWRHVETTVANLLDDPEVSGLVLTSRDDTERRELAEQLRHQAFHDTLTGLANRALFEDRLTHALARAARTARPVAVVFLDLDNFKTVNDSFGHGAGDEVLTTVAQRILRVVRAADTAARFGGDEFAVLVEDLPAGLASVDESIRVAERLLAACRHPFQVQDHEVMIGCSIGIAISEAGAETADGLLRNADVAMYLGKERGKGRYEVFQPEMHARILERLELDADLRLAVERHELVVHYQPIMSLEDGRITGLEALARWSHPKRGLLPPGAFIARAEENGLIVPLGYQVLHQACREAGELQRRYPSDRPLSMTVNLSVRQLEDPNCLGEIHAALQEGGLPPESLVLEITESFAIKDPDVAIRRLTALKALGVRLALDDFGTGFSSLSYLQRLPVDILKIDRSFTERMVAAGRDTSLVEAILALGRSLNLSTVAEGIERPDQLDLLRTLGCAFGQGYLLSRPCERAVVEQLLAAQHTATRPGDDRSPIGAARPAGAVVGAGARSRAPGGTIIP
ncbi:MAG: EAL domain-containing protein [Chloroflexota bacterium]